MISSLARLGSFTALPMCINIFSSFFGLTTIIFFVKSVCKFFPPSKICSKFNVFFFLFILFLTFSILQNERVKLSSCGAASTKFGKDKYATMHAQYSHLQIKFENKYLFTILEFKLKGKTQILNSIRLLNWLQQTYSIEYFLSWI